jgi:primosomal protein N' (replication factor Y)
VRTAVVTSDLPTVREALQGIDELEHVDALDPEPVEEGRYRAIVRFDYGVGGTVAEHLRAAVIRNATGRRSVAREGGSRPRARLQVRLDGPEAFG